MSQNQKGLERRREQNRLAQRRFRERHGRRKSVEQRPRTPSVTSEPYPGQDITPEDVVLPGPSALTISNPPVIAVEPEGQYMSVDSEDVFLDPIDLDCMESFLKPDQGLYATPTSSSAEGAETDELDQILRSFNQDTSLITPESDNRERPRSLNMPRSDQVSFGRSPLHMAVQKGNSKIVRILLEHDADCNTKDTRGLTPLAYATIRGFEDVADLLLAHGAEIQHVDHHDRSAIHWAVIHRRDRFLKKLLKHCAGDSELINGCTKDGKNALHMAIVTGFEAAVEVLLKSGADVHYKARHDEGSNESSVGGII
ncbi:ankyrin repeat-containing domain protein [Trichoderma aethiopicum]